MKRKTIATFCLFLLSVILLCSCGNANIESADPQHSTTITDDVSASDGNDTESTFPNIDITEEFSDDTTIKQVDLSDFIGKTLGDLENTGFEYMLYAYINSEYIFSYSYGADCYEFKVDVPEDSIAALKALSIFDDNYHEKAKSIRQPLIILDIENS